MFLIKETDQCDPDVPYLSVIFVDNRRLSLISHNSAFSVASNLMPHWLQLGHDSANLPRMSPSSHRLCTMAPDSSSLNTVKLRVTYLADILIDSNVSPFQKSFLDNAVFKCSLPFMFTKAPNDLSFKASNPSSMLASTLKRTRKPGMKLHNQDCIFALINVHNIKRHKQYDRKKNFQD